MSHEQSPQSHESDSSNAVNQQEIDALSLPDDIKNRINLFVPVIVQMLPPEERSDFLEHPVQFASKKLLFRAMDGARYSELVKSGAYPVQMGQMGSTGVYLSNSPLNVVQYGEILAIIDREKLVYLDESVGIIRVGTDEYHARTEALMNKNVSVYDVDNHLDLDEVPGLGYKEKPNVRNIVMRKPQPLSATECFLIAEDGAVRIERPGQENIAA